MPLDLGSLEIYMGPDDLGGPDDLEQAIIDFIDRAQSELYIAVQELESMPIAQAVIRARGNGVRVRVILEGLYLTERRAQADPFASTGSNEDNRIIRDALLRARVDVISDLNPDTFHQKFIARDPTGPRAALLTGSTNFTPTGTHANLNHICIFRGRRVAGLYLEEFEEAWSGTFGQKNERHDRAPQRPRLSRVKLKVLFSPDHAPEMEIMKQCLNAQQRIDFAMFTFAQSSGIDDTLIRLSQAGVQVRGVLDRGQANQRWAATHPLAQAGVVLRENTPGNGVGKIHHKLAVIDDSVTIVGSFNYTGTANALNDENIIVIGDIHEDNPVSRQRQTQVATFARAEIDRISNNLCRPI